MNNNDSYGDFIPDYTAYTDAENGMELLIGRRPAHKALGNLSGVTVLDFGCGPGTNGADLRGLGARQVVGIDVSERELAKARQIDPHGTYLHYNGQNLAEVVEQYEVDAILASFSICTIPSKDLEVIFKDMRTLLDGGKKLVIIDPNFQRSLGVRYPGELHYHGRRYGVVQSGDHIRVTLGEGENAVKLLHDIYHSHDDYRRMLTEAGFTIEVFEEVRPDDACNEGWAKKARKYPPFLLIKAS